ncbi:MAG: hypothetical protein FWE37_02535 [Spirochaetaceae bacterium]|nr:hypothetical protein [Spirochaetaceae bacterium]
MQETINPYGNEDDLCPICGSNDSYGYDLYTNDEDLNICRPCFLKHAKIWAATLTPVEIVNLYNDKENGEDNMFVQYLFSVIDDVRKQMMG